MPILRPLVDLVRLAPARPAIAAGLRAGAAAVLPLVASQLLSAELLSYAGMGGFMTALVDKGGAYRTRGAVMAAVVLFGCLASFLGSLAANSLVATLPLAFLWLLGAGLAQAGGAGAASAGTLTAIILVVALARPVDSVEAALASAAAVAAGGLAAMAMALLLWPVRLYRPARFAIARCWDALAEHAQSLADRTPGGEEERARLIHGQRAVVRGHVEEARRILTATRRGRQAESERGERLFALLENADQVLGACIAIDGWLEAAREDELPPIVTALRTLEGSAHAIALLLRTDGVQGRPVPRITETGPAAAPRLLGRLARHLEGAAEAAEGLADARPLRGPAPTLAFPSERRGLGATLRGTIDPRSVILRHALRLALAGTAAAAAVGLLRIEYGYWVTITVVAILQPWTAATIQRGLQRIGGTVLGALIAIAAVAWVDDRLTFAAIVFVLCSASVALLPLNYGVFSVLLTPAFVLLAELGTGDYQLAWIRILDTLVGGAIALVAARLLWPAWEKHRFPEELAAALRSSAGWMRQLGEGDPDSTATERARRQVGIAVLNAEASLQRLLAEAWREDLEPLIALTLYLRRVHATALALFSDRSLPAATRRSIGAGAAVFLEQMADAIAAGLPPAAGDDLPGLEALAGTAQPLAERLVRQLFIVHGAAVRGFAGGAFR
ncbi:FUSC family protein [Vulgatibacter sp.]|uniref:FUSC family protein n=1 Tax=Vulgatibacter sp. TaxID=1971226 RepID=UPI003568D675